MGEENTTINEPTVVTDVACARCGYNLRTLRRGGLCPECAEPVERSYLQSLPESFRWQRLRRGAVMLALSPWANVAAFIVMLNTKAQEPDLLLALVWMSPHLVLHGTRAAAIIMIVGSRPGQRTRAQRLCLALGVVLAIFWLFLILYALSMNANLGTTLALLSIIFLIEGFLTFSAHHWVRSPTCPFRIERYSRIWPRALYLTGCLLCGASAALLAMAAVPGLESSWAGVALRAFIWIAFLFSRAAHVFFWLLIADIVNQRLAFIPRRNPNDGG